MNSPPATNPNARIAANFRQTRRLRRETVERPLLPHLLQKHRQHKFEGNMRTDSTSRASKNKSIVPMLHHPHLRKNYTISEDFSDGAQLHQRRLIAVAGNWPNRETQKSHASRTPHMPNATPNQQLHHPQQSQQQLQPSTGEDKGMNTRDTIFALLGDLGYERDTTFEVRDYPSIGGDKWNTFYANIEWRDMVSQSFEPTRPRFAPSVHSASSGSPSS